MRFFLLTSLLVTLTACSSSSNNTDSVQYLTLLHTNDNHGRFWHNEQGEYGMAARKTLIDQLKADAKAKALEAEKAVNAARVAATAPEVEEAETSEEATETKTTNEEE